MTEKTITLTCKNINEANAILALLGKCPFEQVADMIARFQAEIQKQTSPPTAE